MSGGEIAFLVISVLLVGVIFLTKSKAHERDNRIRPRRERERDQERERENEREQPPKRKLF